MPMFFQMRPGLERLPTAPLRRCVFEPCAAPCPSKLCFQGVVKKHNFDGQGAAHGSKTHRRNGAVGNRSNPGRIWKNMGMPGHLGDERVTVQNLQVMQVREAEKVILISGAVPGCNGSYVVVRPAIKNPAAQIKLHQQHAKQDKAVAKKHEAEKKSEEKKRSEEHTSELQSRLHLVCRLLLEKKKKK